MPQPYSRHMTQSNATPLHALDWAAIEAEIASHGHARVGPVLSPDQCSELANHYDDDALYRSTIDMARYRFGQGQYRYFAYPLPPTVADMRRALYEHLAPIANRMAAQMGQAADFPASHEDYLARCHKAQQQRPTPLILRYGQGDYNCLHQDLYGDLVFPLQGAVLLSRPGIDFDGGEFMLVEQRPRAQSIGQVVALRQGEMVVFPVNERPVEGTRGTYRCRMRHGVSRVLRGERLTLGLILHDAK